MKLKTKKISGIYLIKNIKNDMVYVGSSKDVYGRWTNHKSLLKQNKHGNKNLQDDFIKYGIDCFTYELVEECLQRDLPIKEREYKDRYGINVYNENNILSTHKQIRRGREAKIFKEKYSKLMQGENNPNCTKFNEASIREVKLSILRGEPLDIIAERYNTTVGYISSIKLGYKWKHVQVNDIDNNRLTGGDLLI
jgi:group I intron endonuclease